MNPKIIVFDTNTLISGLIFKSSVPRQALAKGLSVGTLVYSDETFTELERVIKYPKFDKYANQNEKDSFLADYKESAVLIEHISTKIIACRDPKDDKFLTLAVAANAEFIVTGDDDLLVLHPFRGIQIIKPAEFLKLDF
jgi:uncharacterized protein